MHAHPLMDKPAVNRLRAAESVAMAGALSGQAGAHGLCIGMTRNVAMGLPRMGCWTRLRLAHDGFDGDLRCRVDELLPFADDSFRVVVLSHVLEWTPHAAQVLDEAVRVLEPEGKLVVVGFHPFSAWTPWLLCRRRPRPMLIAPAWLRQRLRAHSVQWLQVRRCGAWLPRRHGGTAPAALGGGFLLLARKRRTAVMKLRAQTRQRRADRHSAWAPGTHRECA